MWRIRHISWIKNMLTNAEIQRIFLSNLHGSEQLQFNKEKLLHQKLINGAVAFKFI
jgi:hypothetical protein